MQFAGHYQFISQRLEGSVRIQGEKVRQLRSLERAITYHNFYFEIITTSTSLMLLRSDPCYLVYERGYRRSEQFIRPTSMLRRWWLDTIGEQQYCLCMSWSVDRINSTMCALCRDSVGRCRVFNARSVGFNCVPKAICMFLVQNWNVPTDREYGSESMTSSIEECVYTDGIPQDATIDVDVQREIIRQYTTRNGLP